MYREPFLVPRTQIGGGLGGQRDKEDFSQRPVFDIHPHSAIRCADIGP